MVDPELAGGLPQLLDGAIHQQPALVAFTQNLHITHLQGGRALNRGHLRLSGLQRQGRYRLVLRGGVARVFGQLGQIRRHFQGAGFLSAFVVDLVFLNDGAGRHGKRQANYASTGKGVLHFHASFLG